MLENSNSQAKQDCFVYALSKKKNGLFFDIGSHDPIRINNTYMLEKLGWKGYLFDCDIKWKSITESVRTSKFICTDVSTYDWDSFLKNENLVGKTFDYLSFDVDEASLSTLRRFPFERIKFNICTIEHDRYRFGIDVANEMRRIMIQNGYKLLCKDICNDGYPYEDWYVHSTFMTDSEIQNKYCENLEWKDALKIYI
jgi:hypothetical protein